MKVVPLHDAREAAALAGADHIDLLAGLEDLVRLEHGADLGLGRRRRVEPKLADIALRLTVGLGEHFDTSFAQCSAAFGAVVLRNMAALGADRLAARLVLEAELHRVVAVALGGANLQHRAGAQLQHGDGGHPPRFVEDLRHADFQPK
jgi:hypothetical protein